MLIVDAYNVLHLTGVLPPDLAGLDVPGLIGLVAKSRYGRRSVTVVCDGGGSNASGARFGRARVLFSGHQNEADDVIERLIDRYAHGGGLSVVSSDKRLRRAAKCRGAESIASERFLEELADDARHPERERGAAFVHEVPLDPYSVRHWLEEFGLDVPPPAPPAPAAKEKPAPRAKATVDKKAEPPAGFGERLRVELPKEPAPPAEPVEPEVSEPPAPAQLPGDPVVRQALEEWRGSLTLDDLDMRRWISGVTPIKKRPGSRPGHPGGRGSSPPR